MVYIKLKINKERNFSACWIGITIKREFRFFWWCDLLQNRPMMRQSVGLTPLIGQIVPKISKPVQVHSWSFRGFYFLAYLSHS